MRGRRSVHIMRSMPVPDWIRAAPPDGFGGRTNITDASELHFLANQERAETLVETSDPCADYSYDDWALCSLDGELWVFNTWGCSCPSPDETWRLEFRGTREEFIAWMDQAAGGSSFDEFARAVVKAGFALTRDVSPRSERMTDW